MSPFRRLTLERRTALALLPLAALALGGLYLLSQLVFAPEVETHSRERLRLGLEARALPLVARLHAMSDGLAALDAGPDAAAWDEASRAYFRAWPEAEEIFRWEQGDDGGRIQTLQRHSTASDVRAAGRARAHVAVAGADRRVQLLAGHRIVDPVVRIETIDGRRRTWLVRASDDGATVVGTLLRAGACAARLQDLLDGRPTEALLFDAGSGTLAVGAGSSTLGAARFRAVLDGVDSDTGTVAFEDARGADWLAAYLVDPDLGLVVALGAPRDALFADFRRWVGLAMGMALLAILVAAAFVLRMTHRFRVPLVRLAGTMQEVSRGDLSQRLPVEGQPEFADLARAFNTMISDLHTTHAALRAQSERLANALREVEDVEAMKDSFLALVSHEVRTPLTSIMGGVELLRDERPDDRTEVEEEFFDIVYDSARRLSSFMNDAILMASLQANRSRASFEMFSLTGLVRSHVESLSPRWKAASIEVENRMEAQHEFFVLGDWTLMQVAIEKVLHNALRHNRSGGRVVIELVERVLEDPDGDLPRTMTARGAEAPDASMTWRAVRVFNTGDVIPPERIQTLFDRFELTHDIANHQRGSGLSLPIANYVIGFHHGVIEVRRVDDEGMAFYLVLPGRVGVEARRRVDDVPDDVDETVAAAHRVRTDDAAAREALDEAQRTLEEVLVGDDADVETAEPEPTGERVPDPVGRPDA